MESLEIKAYDLPLTETIGDRHKIDVGIHNDVHGYIWLPIRNFWVNEDVLLPLVGPQEVHNQLGFHTINNSCNRYGAKRGNMDRIETKTKDFYSI